MRALAVITVVLFHAGVDLPGGFVAVDLFFVISGFVITAMLLRQLATTGRIDLRQFYVRRIRRLMPALGLALVGTLLASAVLQSPFGYQQDTAAVGLGASVWGANIAILGRVGGYFDRAADDLPLLHMWSLSVEEQFYVVFPLLLLVGWRLARRRIRGAGYLLGALAAASFVFNLLTSHDLVPFVSRGADFAYYMAPTRAWEFVAGALVAIALHHGWRLPARLSAACGAASLLGILASFTLIDRSMPFPGWVALAPVALMCLLITAGANGGGPAYWLLSWRPMTWIGDRSYGWYLWHWPFIVFAALLWPDSPDILLVAGALALVPTYLSYRFVEEPIRRGTFSLRRQRSEPRASRRPGAVRVVAAAMVLPAGLFVAYDSILDHHWGNDRLADAASQTESYPEGYDQGCHEGGPLPERNLADCTWHPQYSDTTYLLGDSNAGMYADGLIEATEQAHQRLIVGARSSCPFILASVTSSAADTEECDEYVAGTLDWLLEQPPGTVLLGSAASEILNDATTLTDPNTGRVASTGPEKATLWTQAQKQVIDQLQSAGHRVVVIGVVPHFYLPEGGSWTMSHCALIDFAVSVEECGATQSRAHADQVQKLSLQAEQQAADAAGAPLLDLRDELCPDGTCQTIRDDTFLYRDGKHLSRAASLQLAPELAAALSA